MVAELLVSVLVVVVVVEGLRAVGEIVDGSASGLITRRLALQLPRYWYQLRSQEPIAR